MTIMMNDHHDAAARRMIGGFSEVPLFIQRLPIFYKQRNYHFL